MKKKHLSEQDLQQFVLNEFDCSNYIIEHINLCEKCKIEVEIYESIFAEIKKETSPVFEFDVSSSVLQNLSEKQKFSMDNYLFVLLSGILIVVLSVFIYLTTQYFPTIFNEVSFTQFSLIIVTSLLISAFIYIDMKKNYKERLNFS